MWVYADSVTGPEGETVYKDVSSANGAFVGVVTVGLTGGANWYSDGSLIIRNSHYFPYDVTNRKYYDYLQNKLYVYDLSYEEWQVSHSNPTVFDQVPADFISYLRTDDFSLSHQ